MPRGRLASYQASIFIFFALFKQHNRNTIFDWVAVAIAAIDQPLFTGTILNQLDWPFVTGIRQNSQQLWTNACLLYTSRCV